MNYAELEAERDMINLDWVWFKIKKPKRKRSTK